MKKLFLLSTIIIFLAFGCSMQKYCFEKFPPEIVRNTLVTNSIEYRDTVLNIQLPGKVIHTDTITMVIPCPDLGDSVVLAPGPFFVSDTLYIDGDYGKAKVWLNPVGFTLDGGAKVALAGELVEGGVLQVRLDSIVKQYNHLVEITATEIHDSPPVKKIPWHHVATFWGFWVLLFLWILLIVLVVLRK